MEEISFLIWNIKSKGGKFLEAIKEVYETYKPDFFLLVESDLEDSAVHSFSNNNLKSVMLYNDKDVRLYVNPKLNVNMVHEELAEDGQRRQIKDRLVFFRLEINGTKILITGIHFPSKKNHPDEQYSIMKRWVGWVRDQEILFKTKHTIIFGDFNLNPFDKAMYRPDALNAHPTTNHKAPVEPQYYNPMWSTMGDFIYKSNDRKIPASYFFETNEDRDWEINWNCMDGVLIKRTLEPNFIRSELEIITKTNNHLFASDFEIFSKKYSDHLPVKFKIKIS